MIVSESLVSAISLGVALVSLSMSIAVAARVVWSPRAKRRYLVRMSDGKVQELQEVKEKE
jgi:uncharacterized membrane protein